MDMCPICWQPTGRHWTIPHVWMPSAEQHARRRWFSEEEAEAWRRRRLAEFFRLRPARVDGVGEAAPDMKFHHTLPLPLNGNEVRPS
jgi:hypothetical protein